MCVIVLKDKDAEFPEESFNKCWFRNGHGAGLVVINDENPKGLLIKGLMTKDEAFEAAKPFLGKGHKLIMHFRVKSVGKIDKTQTHPFPLGDRGFLFHNGTSRMFNPPVDISDTNYVADFLTELSDEDIHKFLTFSTNNNHGKYILVLNGKVTIFTPEKEDYQAVKNPKTIDGVWYSNTQHVNATAPSVYGDDDYCSYAQPHQQKKNTAPGMVVPMDTKIGSRIPCQGSVRNENLAAANIKAGYNPIYGDYNDWFKHMVENTFLGLIRNTFKITSIKTPEDLVKALALLF